MRHSCVVAAALLALIPLAAAASPPLPAGAASPSLHIVDVDGGRIVTLAQDFRDGIRSAQRYFGGTYHLSRVVRSTDGTRTLGAFDAQLAGVDVTGIEIAATDGRGNAQTAFMFDRTERFAKSASTLAQHLRLATTEPVASSGRDVPSADQQISRLHLNPVRAQDGTVSAALPDGWQPLQVNDGVVIAKGPANSSVVMNLTLTFVDPTTPAGANSIALSRSTGVRGNAALPYSDDPARVYIEIGNWINQLAHKPATDYHIEAVKLVSSQPTPFGLVREYEIAGSQEGGGLPPMRYDALLTFGRPGPTGSWTVVASGMAAPVDRYRDLGVQMLAIVKSFRYDAARENAYVQAGIDQGKAITAKGWSDVQAGIAANEAIGRQNQAKVDASMASARAVQDGIDRSTAGFVHYLGDTDVVRSSNGSHTVMSQSAANALTQFDPQHYQSVPVSQYTKGIDY